MRRTMKNLMNNDMTGKYNWMKRHRVEILGVLIITMIHLITMATNHCTFFGDNVYVGGDNQAQLLGYVSEFRRKILNGESPLYTWHAVGGIGFYTPFIWCLTNVTLLILSFFPYEYFNDVCDTLYVIHSVVLFLSIRYYLANREFGKRFSENSYEILLFAVPYALAPAYYNSALYCSYLIEYALMPFVILGLERIVLNKGWKLYFISLALLMINNFYIGAMGCIFIMLYYFTLNFDSVKGFINKSIKVLLISVPAVTPEVTDYYGENGLLYWHFLFWRQLKTVAMDFRIIREWDFMLAGLKYLIIPHGVKNWFWQVTPPHLIGNVIYMWAC